MKPQRLSVRQAMIHAGEMGAKAGKPECYYWHAVWWRLSAKESKVPNEHMRYSRNQMTLYKDMLRERTICETTLR